MVTELFGQNIRPKYQADSIRPAAVLARTRAAAAALKAAATAEAAIADARFMLSEGKPQKLVRSRPKQKFAC